MANNRKKTSDKKRTGNGFSKRMQKKLLVLFLLILVAFAGLSARLAQINRYDGNKYKKQVLSQQQYDSKTIPYKRGDILDSKGTSLAVSEKVYSVILDTKALLRKEEYLEPTLSALKQEFDIDESAVRAYINSNQTSQYYVLKKQCSYDDISGFLELQNDTQNNPNIQGVWFDESYVRKYPNSTLACDVIGFTNGDNNGMFGLEEYYDDVLNGTPGREYGYLNDDSTLERTTIAAVDGYTIVSTIDANIQRIVEKYMKEFSEAHRDEVREGPGAENIGCIIMDVHSGEILAMASYPDFDLNDPYNLSEWYTDEEVQQMKDDDTYYSTLNGIWRNFCISDTYEPGSVAKTLTVAGALETGAITGNEHYICNGSLEVGGHTIRCHNTYGDGDITVKEAIEKSCNVALMHIGQTMGISSFLKESQVFNIGLKTNIDLAGEARTASLVFNESTMGPSELATSTFGQGYNVTMIEMIAAFSSLVNGGYYYEPHMVSKIQTGGGATVKNIEPRVLKQTISASTSEKLIDYCNGVVTEGTGHTARPAGYAIGGKTGTAEMVPRDKTNYVVSFMGYAPANDPQIAIYVVVDRPNVARQDDAKFATGIVRNILTEVLPYMNIFMTEELSEKERQELEEKQLADTLYYSQSVSGNEATELDENGNPIVNENGDEGDATGEEDGTTDDATGENAGDTQPEDTSFQAWKNFPVDPETGYLKDPDTGDLVDPETGHVMGSSATSDVGTGVAEAGTTTGWDPITPGTPAEPAEPDTPSGDGDTGE